MNRRSLLAALGTGATTALAGCIQFLGSTSDDPSESEVNDSDLDGVPDDEDYAPWDAGVQEKSDVLDEYWGRNISPDESDIGRVNNLLLGTTPTSGRSLSPNTTSPITGMSHIAAHSSNSVSLFLRSEDRPTDPHRVLVVAREFPRRGVIDYTVTDVLEADGDLEVTLTLDEALDVSETPTYYAAYTIPDGDVSDLGPDGVTYLHETDPFYPTSDGLSPASTDNELDAVHEDSYSRTPVEGGYTIHLSGRTNGTDWDIVYFVSRSAYERKRVEPRGRSREEYVRYALSGGTGTTFVDIVSSAARRAGITGQAEQAVFALDVVQALPYVQDDVGTGFDDYPKFIEETMTEIAGDCEDSTIALAVLLSGFGFDVVLVEFESHIGLGVAGDFSGSYVVFESQQYYYVETTSEGWAIGDLPRNLDANDVKISAV